jgi:argininosuccinate lyase
MTNKMWGGRFASSPAAIMEEINTSISFDKRLWRQDIAGSKAHAAMLAATGILTRAEAKKIADGLDQIAGEIESGKFKFSTKLEDIHLNIESRLKDLIGPVAGTPRVRATIRSPPISVSIFGTRSIPSMCCSPSLS